MKNKFCSVLINVTDLPQRGEGFNPQPLGSAKGHASFMKWQYKHICYKGGRVLNPIPLDPLNDMLVL